MADRDDDALSEPEGVGEQPDEKATRTIHGVLSGEILGVPRPALTLVAAFLVVALAAWWLTSRGDDLDNLASETCAELDGAIMMQVGPILNRAINEAQRMGSSAPELGDRLREQCPGTMEAMDNFSEDQERREGLADQVSLELEGCFSDGARGTVTNHSSSTVQVFIDAVYLNDEGTVVDSSTDSAGPLDPGQRGEWDTPYFGEEYARCEVEVDTVREQ